MAALTPETGSHPSSGLETKVSTEVIHQPLAVSTTALAEFLSGLDTISESNSGRAGEDIPAQTSGGTGGAIAQGGQSSGGASVRDQAIANLPSSAVMQREIAKHIKSEVKKLRKEAKRAARISQPGGAHQLVQIYSKIHRLNSVLKEIFEAGLDMVKRLYIRIFVDRQAI
jgi:hypothetical protein